MEPPTPPIFRTLLKRNRSFLSPLHSSSFPKKEDLLPSRGEQSEDEKKSHSKKLLLGDQEKMDDPPLRKRVKKVEGNEVNECLLNITPWTTASECSPMLSPMKSFDLEGCWKINEEIKELLEKNGGCLTNEKEVFFEEYKFTVRCSFSHYFETTLLLLRASQWCKRCAEKLEKIRDFVFSKKKLTLLSTNLESELLFKCPFNHQFSTSYKNYQKADCFRCRNKQREESKKEREREEEKIFRERAEKQSRLFEESKRKMLDESDPAHQNKEKTEIFEAYDRINSELNEMASKYAEAYAKEDDSNDFDQALAVYRMLLLPEDIFRIYLNTLDNESLKKEYRNLARKVHPDKNSHPKSGMAFQKLTNIYEDVAKKFIHSL